MHTSDSPATIAHLGARDPVAAMLFIGIAGKWSIFIPGVCAKVKPAHHPETADGLDQGPILEICSDNDLFPCRVSLAANVVPLLTTTRASSVSLHGV